MDIIMILLLVLGLLCFLGAAAGRLTIDGARLIGLGLAAWITTAILAWVVTH